MEAIDGNERRQHRRSEVQVEVLVRCREKRTEGSKVTVHDISLSGMAFYPGTLTFNLEDKLCLCFAHQQIECSKEHVIEATVVHVNKGIVGVRFDSVGVNILKDIQRLLKDVRIF